MAMDRADQKGHDLVKRPGYLAPDTTLPGPSRTKALHDEIGALKAKGQELAKAVHALAGEGSFADAPYWRRASELAAEMEGMCEQEETS